MYFVTYKHKTALWFAGVYSEVTSSETWNVTHRIYAHRSIAELFVTEFDLLRSDAMTSLTFQLDVMPWTASRDLTFIERESGMEDVT